MIAESVHKLLSSRKTTLVLLALTALCLGAATIVEKFYGTGVSDSIYHSPVVFILWLLMVVNWWLVKSGSIASRTLHFSFVVILTGALLTYALEKEGHLELERSQTSHIMVLESGDADMLPFTVTLDSLCISHFPGTGTPSSYTSYVKVNDGNEISDRTISVNKPLRYKGYRIYQESYNPQTMGSLFKIAWDPFGSGVTYLGYAILFVSILMLAFSRSSRFRKLYREIS